MSTKKLHTLTDSEAMDPYYQDEQVTFHHGDARDVLASLPDNSVDAVVTDPPYGLANTTPAQVAETLSRWTTGDRNYTPAGRGFMGQEWDAFVPPPAVWDECYRVLKPGGHLAVFAGSRTQDLMGISVRLAGFDVRDSVAWLYGSGFPKSLNVGKALDKMRTEDLEPAAAVAKWLVGHLDERGLGRRDVSEHFEAANIAQQWTTHWIDGAVKPRVPRWEQWQELRTWLDLPDDMDAEVWRLNGRKGSPGDAWQSAELVGIRKGAMSGWSMDGSTKFVDREDKAPNSDEAKRWQGWGTALKPAHEPILLARKPLQGTVAANVTEWGTGAINIDACRIGGNVPSTTQGQSKNAGEIYGADQRNLREFTPNPAGRFPANVVLDEHAAHELDQQSGATGGASRFFYVAKASKRERPNIDGVQHPTVKPLALMRWLVRLLTPPGGVVLDPFAGSGTTLLAAVDEDRRAIGVELEERYCEIIAKRLA